VLLMRMLGGHRLKDEIDERTQDNRRFSTDETASELNITHTGNNLNSTQNISI
jgi:hypothetical protein